MLDSGTTLFAPGWPFSSFSVLVIWQHVVGYRVPVDNTPPLHLFEHWRRRGGGTNKGAEG